MSERFFCEHPITGASAELTGAEAHHLLHVMRARPGDLVTLFDGRGAEFEAQIAGATRTTAHASVLARHDVSRERPTPLVLAVALPKGDRQKLLVEKLTELGVARLIPLVAERGVAKLTGGALDKLRRGVIEASKQCGRNVLMTIDEPLALADVLALAPADASRLIAHPGDSTPPETENPSALWRLVGPEGGFTDSEVELAEQSGWRRVSLGPRILRVETAAIALAAGEPA